MLDFRGLTMIRRVKNTSKKYIFWVRTYFDEFKAAVNRYINGLENGTENLQNLEDSLNDKPELL